MNSTLSASTFVSAKKCFAAAGLSILILTVAGCGSDALPKVAPAPEKPLSAAEQSLLSQLESLSKEKRQAFMMAHVQEVQQFSLANKAFGDRMNTIMGIPARGATN